MDRRLFRAFFSPVVFYSYLDRGSVDSLLKLFINSNLNWICVKPLTTLSSRRPLPNIFNIYTILTVLLQFAVHFCCLIYLVREATSRNPKPKDEFPDLESEFKPSILNSTVYIISISLQVSTFAVNYKVCLEFCLNFSNFIWTYLKGHPFMESLTENKPLLWSIICSFLAVVALVTGLLPDLSNQFGIVDFPLDVSLVCLKSINNQCFQSFESNLIYFTQFNI